MTLSNQNFTPTIYLILSGRWLLNTFIVIFKSSLHNIGRKCDKDCHVQNVNCEQKKRWESEKMVPVMQLVQNLLTERRGERLVIVQGFRCNPMNLRVVT